jgi:LuxR family quorum-sensing system transcriptional regulator CciR
MRLDRHDRGSFDLGAREGLNEGIIVPYLRLGDCMGSCTFAGTARPELAKRFLGPAQMIGIFAIDVSTAIGQAAAAIIMSAYSLNKTVSVVGTGACSPHPDTEAVDLVIMPG